MNASYESNPLLDKLPQHLKQFIIPQNYEDYTPINHAVWRYVMRKNVNYLAKVAHHSYLDGLRKTGISIDAIPNMYGMNRILKEIGWAAVAVDGFIPPNAFMEFQAYNVLVIACDIRQLENIEYTPAPDIIHEAAGHAPIIADPEYAEYLKRFGEIGSKAISSAKDYELYEAIRLLSILKEAEGTPQEEIDAAEKAVEQIQNNMGEPSEMALIRNLHWWTVEYGLIGTVDQPKIYGAGLLSSIGESEWCMKPEVKKIPYSLEAAHTSFDITKPQPHLYVTPDFAYLSTVLNEFANSMALRTGGASGVQKLINSKALGTAELSSGLQISGVFTDMIVVDGQPAYLQTTGPTALAYHEREIISHGTEYHAEGYGTAVGRLHNSVKNVEDLSPGELIDLGIIEGQEAELQFDSGVLVKGVVITGKRDLKGKILLISFKNCTVTFHDRVLFRPEWGVYDLAIGAKVISAFSGPADPLSFDHITHVPSTKTAKHRKTPEREELESFYAEVRKAREEKKYTDLHSILEQVKDRHPGDWLLPLEIAELAAITNDDTLTAEAHNHLEKVKSTRPEIAHLINFGQQLITEQPV